MSESYEIELTDGWKQHVDFIPEGYEALGVVRRKAFEEGALLHHEHSGRFYFFTRDSHRSLEFRLVIDALKKLCSKEIQ